jgi:MFS family permease
MSTARRVVGFINVAHAIDHMFMLIFPTAVLGMSGAFGKSYDELLTLSIGGFIAFGAGSLPSGWLGDKWSRRNMLAIFFLGIGASAMLTGFSPTPLFLAIGLSFIGLFASIYHPVGTAMLAANARKLGRDIGINGVWGNLGIAFAALTAGALTQFFGWRHAFFVPGLISVAIGVVYMVIVPQLPANAVKPHRESVALPRPLLIRAFSVLALVSVFGSIVFSAVTISLPKVFDERIVSLATTPFGIGVLVFCVYVLGSVSQIIVGRLIDRHSLRDVFLPLSALQAPALFLVAFSHDWVMLLLAAVMMFAIFGQVTINDTMVARYTSDAWRSRAYALRYFMSFGASACAVPLITLLHGRTAGFELTFQILAIFGLVVFLGAVIFPRQQCTPAPYERQGV